MKKNRLYYSLMNSSISMFIYILRLIIQFVGRSFFISFLGAQYLGLNGLFTNILSFLSLAELGIGTSIIYSLYKPLAQKDYPKITALMQLYKKAYETIGLLVGVLGVAIIPFLKFLINGNVDLGNIYLFYILFLLNSVLSYFFTYKRSLIIADQKNYITAINDFIFLMILNIIQVVTLFLYQNFVLFLILQIVFTMLSNISISHYANKRYNFLKTSEKFILDNDTKTEIKNNVIGNMSSKIGGVIVLGTDNILISIFINLTAVGIYSNYSLISTSLQNLCKQITNSITASVGNFAVLGNKKDSYQLFKRHFFINQSLVFFSSIILMVLMDPFIRLWVGNKFVLSNFTTFLIVFNFAIQVYRNTGFVFIESFGLYWQQRKKPIIEAGLNLLLSLILLLVFHLGINGVLIGTIISSLCFVIWYEAFVVYKYVFEEGFNEFVKLFLRSLFELIISMGIVVLTINFFISGNGLKLFLAKAMLSLIITLILYLILYNRRSEFKFIVSVLSRFLQRT